MDSVEALKHVERNGVEGALLECGVKAGRQEVRWIKHILNCGFEMRSIYLVDTFAGMTEPSEHDWVDSSNERRCLTPEHTRKRFLSQQRDGFNEWCYCNLESVKMRLEGLGYDNSKLHYVVGDVRNMLHEADLPEQIAILRLDTDFYDSTLVELEILFPRLSVGGVLIVDDYYLWRGQQKAVDEYLGKGVMSKCAIRGKGHIGYFILREDV